MTNATTFEVPSKQTKFGNIVRHPVGYLSRNKCIYTGTGASGKKYLISSNGTWYSTSINFKSTLIGYKLDEVSESLKQL
jgi:hypothetical protein